MQTLETPPASSRGRSPSQASEGSDSVCDLELENYSLRLQLSESKRTNRGSSGWALRNKKRSTTWSVAEDGQFGGSPRTSGRRPTLHRKNSSDSVAGLRRSQRSRSNSPKAEQRITRLEEQVHIITEENEALHDQLHEAEAQVRLLRAQASQDEVPTSGAGGLTRTKSMGVKLWQNKAEEMIQRHNEDMEHAVQKTASKYDLAHQVTKAQLADKQKKLLAEKDENKRLHESITKLETEIKDKCSMLDQAQHQIAEGKAMLESERQRSREAQQILEMELEAERMIRSSPSEGCRALEESVSAASFWRGGIASDSFHTTPFHSNFASLIEEDADTFHQEESCCDENAGSLACQISQIEIHEHDDEAGSGDEAPDSPWSLPPELPGCAGQVGPVAAHVQASSRHGPGGEVTGRSSVQPRSPQVNQAGLAATAAAPPLHSSARLGMDAVAAPTLAKKQPLRVNQVLEPWPPSIGLTCQCATMRDLLSRAKAELKQATAKMQPLMQH